jgi:O-methyltransferase
MFLESLLRRLVRPEFQPPANLPRRIVAACGYYRLRTWVASRGNGAPDAHLYQPLFSPWDGLAPFEQEYQAIRKHTLVSRDRCHLLWQTLRQALRLPGDVVECGVFRGGTALLAARTIAAAGASEGRQLHLFDSFQGFGQAVSATESFRPGELGRTSDAHVRSLLGDHPWVRIHVGFVPQTFEGLDLGQVAWAHVDLDVEAATRAAIDYLYPRLVPGGFLVFDDYGFPSCAGSRRAVDEAFADKPEVPLCLPTGQAVVCKLGHPSPPSPTTTSATASSARPSAG